MGQDGQSWLELATSLLPWKRSLPTGQWGSVNTPSRLTSFPWEQALLWIECFGIFQNGSFPPSPAGSTRALFSNMNWKIWLSSWRQISQYCGGPPNRVCLDYLALWVVPSEPPAIGQWQVRFSCLVTGSHRGSASVSALVSWGSLYLPISPSWRQWFAVCPYLSYGSKKSYWSFSLFSFLLVRMEWWLASSLHAEWETGSLHHVLVSKFTTGGKY